MDRVAWVDENDNVLGEVSRERAHAEGLLHRIAVTYVVNKEGKILVNERAKDGFLDHSSAGHVEIGESYLEAARRELMEELGIESEMKEIGKGRSLDQLVGGKHSNHVFVAFLTHAESVQPNPTEVKNVFWASPEEIQSDMQSCPSRYTNGFQQSLPILMAVL